MFCFSVLVGLFVLSAIRVTMLLLINILDCAIVDNFICLCDIYVLYLY